MPSLHSLATLVLVQQKGVGCDRVHLYASTAGRSGKACKARWFYDAGTQYEAVLNSKLADLGIEFWTGASLREQDTHQKHHNPTFLLSWCVAPRTVHAQSTQV